MRAVVQLLQTVNDRIDRAVGGGEAWWNSPGAWLIYFSAIAITSISMLVAFGSEELAEVRIALLDPFYH